jgi:hypothetical protein
MSATPHPEPHRTRRQPRHSPAHVASSRTMRRRIVRAPRTHRAVAPQLTALWPFADAEQLPGTTQLAGWLGRVILTVVTRYSGPGDRVLLLAPPTPTEPALSTAVRRQTADPYAGLTEAVWTVTRLGRSTDATTAAAAPDAQFEHSAAPVPDAGKSASGPRLDPLPPRLRRDRDPPDPGSRIADPRPVAGSFDLVVTAVHPRSTDWLRHISWDSILTPTGVLAAVTHSDQLHGRLRDPLPTIVDTFRSCWRGWLDHIGVLHRPLTSPGPQKSSAGSGGHIGGSSAESSESRVAHHDLLLFGPLSAGGAGGIG